MFQCLSLELPGRTRRAAPEHLADLQRATRLLVSFPCAFPADPQVWSLLRMMIPENQGLRQQNAEDNGACNSYSIDSKHPYAKRKKNAGYGLDDGVTPADLGFA